jgi:hypothetical protein
MSKEKRCGWCEDKIKRGKFCDRICKLLLTNHEAQQAADRPVIGKRGPEWAPLEHGSSTPSIVDENVGDASQFRRIGGTGDNDQYEG